MNIKPSILYGFMTLVAFTLGWGSYVGVVNIINQAKKENVSISKGHKIPINKVIIAQNQAGDSFGQKEFSLFLHDLERVDNTDQLTHHFKRLWKEYDQAQRDHKWVQEAFELLFTRWSNINPQEAIKVIYDEFTDPELRFINQWNFRQKLILLVVKGWTQKNPDEVARFYEQHSDWGYDELHTIVQTWAEMDINRALEWFALRENHEIQTQQRFYNDLLQFDWRDIPDPTAFIHLFLEESLSLNDEQIEKRLLIADKFCNINIIDCLKKEKKGPYRDKMILTLARQAPQFREKSELAPLLNSKSALDELDLISLNSEKEFLEEE